jgi:hypothetical protein
VSKKDTIYSVFINGPSVVVRRLKPGHGGYRKAHKKMILRHRDAIERFQTLKKSRKSFNGLHSFQFLDSARTFAMLHLALLESQVQGTLDQVLAYDGSKKSSLRAEK